MPLQMIRESISNVCRSFSMPLTLLHIVSAVAVAVKGGIFGVREVVKATGHKPMVRSTRHSEQTLVTPGPDNPKLRMLPNIGLSSIKNS